MAVARKLFIRNAGCARIVSPAAEAATSRRTGEVEGQNRAGAVSRVHTTTKLWRERAGPAMLIMRTNEIDGGSFLSASERGRAGFAAYGGTCGVYTIRTEKKERRCPALQATIPLPHTPRFARKATAGHGIRGQLITKSYTYIYTLYEFYERK